MTYKLTYKIVFGFLILINSFSSFLFAQPETTPFLNIGSPNGNEFWQVGKTPSITWESANLTSDVVLEYSINNGSSWLPIATVSNTSKSYQWSIPNTISLQCLVRAKSDAIDDVSNAVFEISDDTSSCTIVVLGSSTAYGTGATPIENSWVNLYSSALFQKNTKLNVINLGYPGFTTYQILPTGTTLPDGVVETIDENRNITKALTYNPTAIIVNMPSNDTANGYSITSQLENYATLNSVSTDNSVQMWIATPQPRNFSTPSKIQTQIDVRDEIFSIYTDKAIDFWNDIADVNGKILSNLDFGDGIHLNNVGHNILFNRVLNKNIEEFTCPGGTLNLTKTVINADFELHIFPNPYKDFIFLNFNTNFSGELKAEFYDVLGRRITQKNMNFTFKTGNNNVPIGLKEIESHNQLIFGIFTFKTDNNIIQKRVKLILK
ncbi:GDSL-type esterase/lipase family protein [Gaetbulibacter sp. M235]|uniref:SGNH/GDSL hydrolase family protein n=1 Tax=Gaetbulibacter sp. M235 TaxID=3126510 RepID=UPI00374F542E